MFGEDWFDGVADCALLGDRHDLGDLVRQVHLKHVALVRLEDVEMLRERERERERER